METRDYAIVGLVVLLVLAVIFSNNVAQMTGKAVDIQCSDSDGGDVPFTKGYLSGTDSTGMKMGPGTDRPMTDYCDSTGIYVKEYRCNVGQGDPGWESYLVYCENGCVDGACLR